MSCWWHCISFLFSSGVGRSGVFIVVDRLLQHIAQDGPASIDIYSRVHEMRRYRCWMVQTEVHNKWPPRARNNKYF